MAYERQQELYEDEERDENSPPRERPNEAAIRKQLLIPEKDYMFDSAIKFRRNT